MSAWGALRRAAWLAWVAHAAAGLTMLLVLQHGLETNADVDARLRFLAEQRVAWTLAWLPWNAAALSILYFCVAFAAAHRSASNRTPLGFAVALCGAAVACDLLSESLFMGLLPELTRDRAAFLLWQRAAVLMTGYVANGLYTAALATLVVTTRRAYAAHETALGVLVAAAGVWLSAAALLGSVSGMFWANAALMPGLLLWLLAVARHAAVRERERG